MEVYEYSAVRLDNNEHFLHGTVCARDKIDAFDKVRRQGLTEIRLRKLTGLAAMWRMRTADIR
jgi:type II secretory pathway component PulF